MSKKNNAAPAAQNDLGEKNKTLELGKELASRINNPIPIQSLDKQLLLFECLEDFKSGQKTNDIYIDTKESDYAFALLVRGGMSKIEAYQITHPKSKTKNKKTLYVAASRLFNSAKMKLIFSYIEEQMQTAAKVTSEEITFLLREELKSKDANIRIRAIRYLGEGIGYFKNVYEGKFSAAKDGSLSELDELLRRNAEGKTRAADAQPDKK
jgi:hypothetical protein